MGKRSSAKEYVVEVRRRGGKLRELETSQGRRFLILNEPTSKRFLEVGVELDRGDIEELEGPIAVSAGLALAYRLLAVRDRTESEIRQSLSKRGITSTKVGDRVVQALRRQGYLDDRRLAASYIRYVTTHRPSGPHLLRRKLGAMGVAEEIIKAEVGEALPPEREREIAIDLVRGRLRHGMDRKRAVRRIHGLLSRRGFSSGIVNDICACILRGEITGGHDERED